MNVTVVDGDLLDQDVDVIVNSWNRNIIPWWLLIPQAVSGAIKKRGGLQPFRELGRIRPVDEPAPTIRVCDSIAAPNDLFFTERTALHLQYLLPFRAYVFPACWAVNPMR